MVVERSLTSNHLNPHVQLQYSLTSLFHNYAPVTFASEWMEDIELVYEELMCVSWSNWSTLRRQENSVSSLGLFVYAVVLLTNLIRDCKRKFIYVFVPRPPTCPRELQLVLTEIFNSQFPCFCVDTRSALLSSIAAPSLCHHEGHYGGKSLRTINYESCLYTACVAGNKTREVNY